MALGDIAQPQVALALIGVIIIGLMLYFNVKGAILWGILITWGLGIIAQFTGWYAVNPRPACIRCSLRLVPAQLCGAGRHRVQIRLQLHAEQHR